MTLGRLLVQFSELLHQFGQAWDHLAQPPTPPISRDDYTPTDEVPRPLAPRSHARATILADLRAHPGATARAIAARADIPDCTVRSALQVLRQQGLAEWRGESKQTARWWPVGGGE